MSKHSKKQPQPAQRARLIARGEEDRFTLHLTGNRRSNFKDIYLYLLEISWKFLIALIVLIYVLINLGFAGMYSLLDNGIESATPASFVDAFFFSVQTLSTIGYGKMSPLGLVANLIVTAEVLTGFIFYAMITGIVFAKFSRPTARVIFSNIAVICPYEGKTHLMLRLANQRHNRIVDANVHVALLMRERTSDGHAMRRFYDMSLTRSRMPILQLTWTLMHPIDEHSPLFGMTKAMLEAADAEILVSLVGLDETFSQTIHTRWSYIVDDIHYNAKLEDVIHRSDIGNVVNIDYTKFHNYQFLDTGEML